MKLYPILFLLISAIPMSGQVHEFYDLSDALAHPPEVHSLYLNYHFTEIKPITNSINKFQNLVEFRMRPRMFDFPIMESDQMQKKSPKSPTSLPNSITKCRKLKLIDISNTAVSSLPKGLTNIKSLETLILNNTRIGLGEEMDKILRLENLTELQIINLTVDQSTTKKLEKLSNVKIIRTFEDYDKYYSNESVTDVQMHDTYIVFKNRDEAERFINSMPKLSSKNVNIFTSNDR